jgi:cytochrome c-type biogenesis protein
MEELLSGYQTQFTELLANNKEAPFIFLLTLGFLGGLLSSLLPCILSLLPLNLAYIGTLDIKNKVEAFQKAGSFVLGVAFVLTLLGVFGSFAFTVFTEYKALINLSVGILIFFMALGLAHIIKLPLPQVFTKVPESHPFVVGLVFALVSSPCSSPVLVSVVSIAANLGSTIKSMILMFGYSLGYTAIIFTASLFTGFATQLHWFKANHNIVTKISAAVLAIMGLFYIYIGIRNF